MTNNEQKKKMINAFHRERIGEVENKLKTSKVIALVGDYGVGKTQYAFNSIGDMKKNSKVKYVDATNVIGNIEDSDLKWMIDTKWESKKRFSNKGKMISGFEENTKGKSFFKMKNLANDVVANKLYWTFAAAAVPTAISMVYPSPLYLLGLLGLAPLPFAIALKYLYASVKNVNIVVIDNLDRIDYNSFEQILKGVSNTNNKTKFILIFNYKDINARYKEKYGFELSNPFALFEKYIDSVVDLNSTVDRHYSEIIHEVLDEGVLREWELTALVNGLNKIMYRNYRNIKRALVYLNNNAKQLSDLGFNVIVAFFIQLLKQDDSIVTDVLFEDKLFSNDMSSDETTYFNYLTKDDAENIKKEIDKLHKQNILIPAFIEVIDDNLGYDIYKHGLSNNNKEMYFSESKINQTIMQIEKLKKSNNTDIINMLLTDKNKLVVNKGFELLNYSKLEFTGIDKSLLHSLLMYNFENDNIEKLCTIDSDAFNTHKNLYSIIEFGINALNIDINLSIGVLSRDVSLLTKFYDMFKDDTKYVVMIDAIKKLNSLVTNLTNLEISISTPSDNSTIDFINFVADKNPTLLKDSLEKDSFNIKLLTSTITNSSRDNRWGIELEVLFKLTKKMGIDPVEIINKHKNGKFIYKGKLLSGVEAIKIIQQAKSYE